MRSEEKTSMINEMQRKKISGPDRILSYFKMQWPILLAVTVSGLIYNIGLLAGPWYEGQMTGCLVNILGGNAGYSDMLVLVISHVTVIAVVQISRYIKRFYVRRFANNVNRRMKEILYGSLVRKSRASLKEEGEGNVITKAILDVDDCVEGMRKFTTETFDTGVALLSGMMIIPAVFVFLGRDGMASGPSLTFISLPKVFQAMGGAGHIVGLAFFLMLGFAALTSCVSVMETLVANCMELYHKPRKKMCGAVGIYSLITAVVICLGYNKLYFEVKLPNGSIAQILDIMDYISNNIMMPIVAIGTCILIGWISKPQTVIEEVQKNGEKFSRKGMYVVMVKFITPILLFILFLKSIGLLTFI